MMIEVPSLLGQLDRVLPLVDFAVVGSNDLLQYLFASDRGDPRLAERYDPLSPAVLRVFRQIVSEAERHGTPLSLCGELAGRPLEAMAIIGLGIHRISMAPASIGPIKAMVRELPLNALKTSIDEWIAGDAPSLRERLQDFAARHDIPV